MHVYDEIFEVVILCSDIHKTAASAAYNRHWYNNVVSTSSIVTSLIKARFEKNITQVFESSDRLSVTFAAVLIAYVTMGYAS